MEATMQFLLRTNELKERKQWEYVGYDKGREIPQSERDDCLVNSLLLMYNNTLYKHNQTLTKEAYIFKISFRIFELSTFSP